MVEQIDLSKIDATDESLISLEELFPEYIIGGETFPSGQSTQQNNSQSLLKTTFQQEPTMEQLLQNDISFDDEKFLDIDNALSSTQNTDLDWLEEAVKLDAKENQPVRDQTYWTNKFNQTNFAGMDLMAVTYLGLNNTISLEQHLLLRRVVRDFVRLLSYNYVTDLRSAGVSEEGIFYMKKGRIPENYTVHLKYPLEYGGSIDFNNMVFIQDKPFHDMIHSYIDEQILTPSGISYPSLLYVPVPVGKIYVPFGTFTGSGGKNKQDRSVYAGFSQAAFQNIALKAMPGR
ncbi:MAG: hypothetical protein IJC11_02160 [Alphaproteobacteria bacterium]|nr:hypothetical protein [Alphaproteobacteria bacterium]MBQ3117109.1 hypothetical protein [Alphaproteobacteria bacterium]MBQ6855112.1 hypothetical protein [Alphaproteobacteria bacterium]MBQ8557782.1 hypothetical protein [Alphaproteobacteria bacterium]MBR3913297.1 hypothetical protein [Alphaproteobacteria bacterium]